MPAPRPSKIVCIGRNYLEHARELGNEAPERPLVFLKPPSALIGEGDAILLPPESTDVQHEGEIAVIIGSRASGVSVDDALRHVAGFAPLNDVTARDLQKTDGQWTRAKGFDTFCPLGPMAPVDGIDHGSLEVICRVNGEERQRGSARQMAFDIPDADLVRLEHHDARTGRRARHGHPGGRRRASRRRCGRSRDPRCRQHPQPGAQAMTPRLTRLLGGAVVLIVAMDWATKVWIVNRLRVGDTHSLVDGWLYLAHRRNTGVAFSMFADLPESLRLPILGLLAVVGMAVLGWMAWASASKWIRVGSALALGGAAANLGDRLVNGGVTDFILFSPFPFVFNIADTAITVGAVLLAAQAVFEREDPPAVAA